MSDYADFPVDTGQLKIDTTKLWDYGVTMIPEFSSAYGVAGNQAWQATAYRSYAYQRGSAGEIPPAFQALGEYLEILQSEILYQTSVNLIGVGKTFERIAFELAAQDSDSAENLNKHAESELIATYEAEGLGAPPSPEEHAESDPDDPPQDSKNSEGSTSEYIDGQGIQQ